VEVSRQVAEGDATESPSAAPNEINTNDTEAATRAPAMIALQLKYEGADSSVMGVSSDGCSMGMAVVIANPKRRV
jgi:hypothetical protein